MPGPQSGPNVGDFVDLPMLRVAIGLVLIDSDTRALVTDGTDKLLILDLTTRAVQIAVDGLVGPTRIAVEGQGSTALVVQ